MIPKTLRSFFWDINTDQFEPRDYPEYSIARILELGDEEAVDWLKKTFSQDQITTVLRNDRRLTRRSANYWALVYNIPSREVAALK